MDLCSKNQSARKSRALWSRRFQIGASAVLVSEGVVSPELFVCREEEASLAGAHERMARIVKKVQKTPMSPPLLEEAFETAFSISLRDRLIDSIIQESYVFDVCRGAFKLLQDGIPKASLTVCVKKRPAKLTHHARYRLKDPSSCIEKTV